MDASMSVPLLDVCRQNAPLADDLREAFARVLESGQFIMGPEVERLEAAVAAKAGARYGIGVSSGTDALVVALLALGIGQGDEVICPSFTFFATAGSIVRVGATPVFADSCGECFNIDPDGLERLVTPRTKAIIPVHLFGQPADMREILGFAGRHGLRVIEDAAQALGADYDGRPVGALGDFGTISFYPSKNLGALGDAGMMVTNDAVLAERARRLRNHGAEQQYIHREVGGNFRLDAVQAALLSVKLPYLDEYTAGRQRHAAEYRELLAGLDGAGLLLPTTHPGRTHIVNQYTLRVPGRRDALKEHLGRKGIGTAIYYPLPLDRQECFRPFASPQPLPVAATLAAEAISLPVFAEMTRAEVEEVAVAILQFFA
jgi:dTDP-4-amino-4,6-dideoxygalactose transaminase